jgi:putative phosphoesterase
MRVLIVSDIHGNWEALRAVAESERADRVLCLGDIVDYGPRPLETVRWVREHAHAAVRGNHDTAVAFGVSCRSAPAFRRLAEETRKLTVPMLPESERRYLALLPVRTSLEIDGYRIEMMHAAPEDPLYQYLPATDCDGWQRAVKDIDADLVLVGHTHLQAALDLGGKFMLNPGSVGLPLDGDPRACCAVLDNGRPELKRVRYDLSRTVEALWEWGLPDDVARTLGGMYVGGEAAPVVTGVQT